MIRHHQMHGAGRKIGVSLGNGQRTVEDIESLHRMTDVHDLRFRGDVQDHAFNRSYKVIVEPEVGGQSNGRTMRQRFPRLESSERDRVLPTISKLIWRLPPRQGTEVLEKSKLSYSYLSASIGFKRDAFSAGKKPETIPTMDRITNEISITLMEACRKIAPSWSAVL